MQSLKHESESVFIDEGIEIDRSDEHEQNAAAPR
jgi:hypothetical protein